MKYGIRTLALVGLGVLAGSTMAAGGVALASGAADPANVTACVAKSNGAVRIIDEAARCKATENKTSWSRTGPQGPAGPPGISDYQRFSGSITGYAVGYRCPGGMKVISGGAHIQFGWQDPLDRIWLQMGSWPGDDGRTWWTMFYMQDQSMSFSPPPLVDVFAICAKVAEPPTSSASKSAKSSPGGVVRLR